MTVNEASGQDDPTNDSPVLFDAVFTENVTGFTGSDVTVGGTATTDDPVVTGTFDTYTISIPVTGDGTVTASLNADVADRAVGNGNNASTSTDNTVTVETVDPTVTVNQATGQNDPTNDSDVEFDVVFNENVTGFTAGDFTVTGSQPTAPRC